MKNIIFYFSATGNSLKVARDISQHINETTLISMSRREGLEIPDDIERIGFVFPVYCYGVPLLVVDFIRNLTIPKNKYVFAVVTCGGTEAATLPQTAKLLAEKGVTLSSGFAVKMPDNYIALYSEPEEKRKHKLAQASLRIPQIADAVKQKQRGILEKSAIWKNMILSGVFYKLFTPHFSKISKYFKADSKCIGCEICVRVCPVGNIRMKEDKPIWDQRCQHCLACIHWCPQKAIQLGKGTEKRGRYHHPDVKLTDFIK